VEIPEGKKPLERSRHRWEYNIIYIVQFTIAHEENFCVHTDYLRSFVKIMRSRKIRWTGHAAWMRKARKVYIWRKNLSENTHSEAR
jgi:hypothetical protein